MATRTRGYEARQLKRSISALPLDHFTWSIQVNIVIPFHKKNCQRNCQRSCQRGTLIANQIVFVRLQCKCISGLIGMINTRLINNRWLRSAKGRSSEILKTERGFHWNISTLWIKLWVKSCDAKVTGQIQRAYFDSYWQSNWLTKTESVNQWVMLRHQIWRFHSVQVN